MIRKFLNSTIEILQLKSPDYKFAGLAPDTFFIQEEKINDNMIILESCKNAEVMDLIPFTTSGIVKAPTNQNNSLYDDATINEYGEIVLNNDPFYKYSGCKLKEIILKKDIDWIQRALREMRNEYIRTRIEYLARAFNLI